MSPRMGPISKTSQPAKKKQPRSWMNILYIIFGLLMVVAMVVTAVARY